MKKLVAVLFLVFIACSPQVVSPLASPVGEIVISNAASASTVYYVATNGDDANPGTISSPLRTVTKAISLAQAGTVILLRGGEYIAPATGWQFANSGVTIVNYPGEQVVLTAKNKVSGNYIIKCLQTSLAVDDVKILGSDVNGQKGIVMTGEALGVAPAIVAYRCDNWEVAGVEFRNVAYAIFQRKVNNGNTSADGWYVHDNVVNDYYRESGMQFNGNGNRIENNRIFKVTADSSTTFGCQLLNLLGNNNVVRGNHLERINQSVRCIGIFFEWDLADANLIENNTIAGVPNGMSFFGGDNNTIRNNVLTGTDTAFVIRSWEGTTAYPCNFSDFMPLESDVNNPDWQYMYPHDCRSKGNRFENNTVSGFANFSTINLPEPSNIFVTATPTVTKSPTPTATQTMTATNTPSPTVYYVSDNASVQDALARAKAGDTIYFRAGVYDSFTVAKDGLKILAYPGERPHILGGTGVRLTGNNITLSGFEVTEMVGNYSAGIVSYGDNNVIENNVVHDNRGVYTAGITVSGTTRNRIANNTTYSNGFFGIGVYNSSNAVVTGNISHSNVIAGEDADGVHCSLSFGNTFSGNEVYDNSDDGLDTWDCTRNVVSDNVAYRNGGTGDGNGFKLGLGGLNVVTGNIAYANLTCGFTSNGAGNYYENNISYQNLDCGFEDDWRVSGNTQASQFINNLAWGNPANFRTGQFTTVFKGNSTVAPVTLTPTATSIPTITKTPTIAPTRTPTPTATLLCIEINPTVMVNGEDMGRICFAR